MDHFCAVLGGVRHHAWPERGQLRDQWNDIGFSKIFAWSGRDPNAGASLPCVVCGRHHRVDRGFADSFPGDEVHGRRILDLSWHPRLDPGEAAR